MSTPSFRTAGMLETLTVPRLVTELVFGLRAHWGVELEFKVTFPAPSY